jgi:tetratricopeptide (TPR) repeat protein
MDEQAFQAVNRLRKSGNLDEAWNIGCSAVQENPNDQYLKGAFFWVCYAYLKEVQNGIKARAKSNNGDYIPNSGELERINFLLDWVLWLNIPPGGYEYRSLLLTFQPNLECFSKLVLLLVRISDDLFLDEDKQPFVNEKGESPSLMLKFSRKVAKAWMQNETVRELSVDDICTLFSNTRVQARDSQQLIWLAYDEAKCLIMAKRFEQARDRVLTVLRKKQTESWAWGALAATYRADDPKAALILFSKALLCAQDDVFALPTLKGFAPVLAQQGYLHEASMCVKRAVNCYLENGWNIKADLEKLLAESWYDASVDLEALNPFLEERSGLALDYLFGEREQKVAVVQNIHDSGKGFHAYLNKNKSVSVRLGVFQSKEKPSPGDYVLLTLSAEDQSVIETKPCEQVDLDDVSYFEDVLRVKEKGFGFVDDTFVPSYLIKSNMDGQSVRGVRVLSYDKLKEKYGWKALKIEIV